MTDRSPEPDKRVAAKPLTIASMLVMLLNAAGLLLMGPMVGIMNHFVRGQFAEIHAQLPKLTRFFFATPWWVWCIVFVPFAAGVFLLEFVIRNKIATMAINISISGAVLVFLGAYVLAMALPMFQLMATRV